MRSSLPEHVRASAGVVGAREAIAETHFLDQFDRPGLLAHEAIGTAFDDAPVDPLGQDAPAHTITGFEHGDLHVEVPRERPPCRVRRRRPSHPLRHPRPRRRGAARTVCGVHLRTGHAASSPASTTCCATAAASACDEPGRILHRAGPAEAQPQLGRATGQSDVQIVQRLEMLRDEPQRHDHDLPPAGRGLLGEDVCGIGAEPFHAGAIAATLVGEPPGQIADQGHDAPRGLEERRLVVDVALPPSIGRLCAVNRTDSVVPLAVVSAEAPRAPARPPPRGREERHASARRTARGPAQASPRAEQAASDVGDVAPGRPSGLVRGEDDRHGPTSTEVERLLDGLREWTVP